MNTALIEFDSPLWHLDMTQDKISNMCSAVADKYLEIETKFHVRDVFRDFVRKVKGILTASYLMVKV